MWTPGESVNRALVLVVTIEMNTPGSLSYKHAVTNENLDSPFNTEETNPYYDEEEADEGEDKLRYVLIKSPRGKWGPPTVFVLQRFNSTPL
nr:hypothetical protein Iba_chr01bCG7240 [Ipomoea batatas]GMC51277.1 hypothetical protein Iba_chr01cCG4750 [Ipomoea batatas]GMC51278.1 hypothetical protein Iba_chr01cCG4760 [Ipomoea batatas]